MAVLEVRDEAAVRTITLNRPERRNALTPELLDALTAAVGGAEAAGARLVVLAGAGEAFCAGLDLAVLQAMGGFTAEEHRAEAERIGRALRAVWECPLPTIAAVQGAAIAGGTGLATLCDFTLAAPEARFGYTEVRIGFVPALVSAYLSLQVGAKVAGRLLLSARLLGADEALRVGLVDEVVAREALSGRVAELAAEVMRNSPEAMRATKHLLRDQQRAWLDAALELALEANAAARQTEDFREGIASFLEKRKPRWVG